MNDAILYVVAPPVEPGGVLNTTVPMPTDGLPDWWLCRRCGAREMEDFGLVLTEHEHPGGKEVCQSDLMVPNGPFPVTVGRWAEVDRCDDCDGCKGVIWTEPEINFGERCHGEKVTRVWAIVELLTVSEDSHHADECLEVIEADLDAGIVESAAWCHPDAAPDAWHTPVDVPVPRRTAVLGGWPLRQGLPEPAFLPPTPPGERPMSGGSNGLTALQPDRCRGRDN